MDQTFKRNYNRLKNILEKEYNLSDSFKGDALHKLDRQLVRNVLKFVRKQEEKFNNGDKYEFTLSENDIKLHLILTPVKISQGKINLCLDIYLYNMYSCSNHNFKINYDSAVPEEIWIWSKFDDKHSAISDGSEWDDYCVIDNLSMDEKEIKEIIE